METAQSVAATVPVLGLWARVVAVWRAYLNLVHAPETDESRAESQHW